MAASARCTSWACRAIRSPPMSARCCSWFLSSAGSLAAAMSRRRPTWRLGCDLPANDERADYLRATLTVGPDGIPIATPARVQDSSMLMLLARADCLLVREPHAPPAKAGERCSIIRLAL